MTEEEPPRKLSESEIQRFLKEYELAHAHAGRLDGLVWRTFSAIGIASVAPLIAFAFRELSGALSFSGVSLVGLILVGASLVWWKMAKRWWHIQETDRFRMRDIEEDLGIFLTRYVEFRDGNYLTEKDFSMDKSGLSAERQEILRCNKTTRRSGVQLSLSKLLPLVAFAWLGFSLSIGIPSLVSAVGCRSTNRRSRGRMTLGRVAAHAVVMVRKDSWWACERPPSVRLSRRSARCMNMRLKIG